MKTRFFDRRQTLQVLIAVSVLLFSLSLYLWQRTREVPLIANDLTAESIEASQQSPVPTAAAPVIVFLDELETLDQRYAQLIADTGSNKELEALNKELVEKENLFRKSMEGFFAMEEGIATPVDRDAYKTIKQMFQFVSQARRAMSIYRYVILAGNGDYSAQNQQSLFEQHHLDAKDETIAMLRQQLLRDHESTGSQVDSSLVISLNKEVEQLQRQIADSRREVEQSRAEAASTRNQSASERGVAKRLSDSNEKMQNEIRDLQTELLFADIECSLTRADSRKVVINSRQRREMLSSALQSLESLRLHPNLSVKSRANAKIIELHKIAETVRD